MRDEVYQSMGYSVVGPNASFSPGHIIGSQQIFAEYIHHSRDWDGEGNGTPLQYSCLENPMDGGAWWAAVHGVAKSRRRLSDLILSFHFHALEKEMAIHSSILAWRIPGTRESGGLPSMGSHRVGHDWSDLVVVVVESGLIRRLIRYSFRMWCSKYCGRDR